MQSLTAALNGQRQALFCADLDAEGDGILYIREGFVVCVTLAHTARNGRAFHDPHAVFVMIDGDRHFHRSILQRRHPLLPLCGYVSNPKLAATTRCLSSSVMNAILPATFSSI